MPKLSLLGSYTRYGSKVATAYPHQITAASGVDQSGALNAALGGITGSSTGPITIFCNRANNSTYSGDLRISNGNATSGVTVKGA